MVLLLILLVIAGFCQPLNAAWSRKFPNELAAMPKTKAAVKAVVRI
jgi:hypothetical protein